MKTRPLSSVAALSLFLAGAGSAISLPASIAGTRPVDLGPHVSLRTTFTRLAQANGLSCDRPSGYQYTSPADATAGVNAWLQGRGLLAKTLDETPGRVAWLAASPSTGDLVLGEYSAGAQGGGYVILCGPTPAVARTTSASDGSSSVHVSGRGVFKPLGWGALVVLGLVSRVSGLVRRFTGGGEEA